MPSSTAPTETTTNDRSAFPPAPAGAAIVIPELRGRLLERIAETVDSLEGEDPMEGATATRLAYLTESYERLANSVAHAGRVTVDVPTLDHVVAILEGANATIAMLAGTEMLDERAAIGRAAGRVRALIATAAHPEAPAC